MEEKLKGKVALITGAGRGLGRAYALRLAKLGADVAINDIDLHSYKQFNEKQSADTVVDEVLQLGRRSIGIECDVAQKKEVDGMFKKVLDEFGRIDILVNNAGGLQVNPETSFASSVPEEDLRREIDRNLDSQCIITGRIERFSQWILCILRCGKSGYNKLHTVFSGRTGAVWYQC